MALTTPPTPSPALSSMNWKPYTRSRDASGTSRVSIAVEAG